MKGYGYFKGKQSNKHLVNYYMDENASNNTKNYHFMPMNYKIKYPNIHCQSLADCRVTGLSPLNCPPDVSTAPICLYNENYREGLYHHTNTHHMHYVY